MGNDKVPDNLNPKIEQPWGRLVPCLTSVDSIDIRTNYFKIGRGSSCDVVLSESLLESINGYKLKGTVSKEHCLLTKESDDRFYITDLSKNGTMLNGVNIGKGQKVALKDNDKIGCYKASFYVFKSLLTKSELPDTLTSSESSTLSFTPRVNIPTWGRLIPCLLHLKSFDLNNLTFKVGRSSSCDAVIDNMGISSRIKNIFSEEHFILVKDPETSIAYITDLSPTGTYLNARLIGRNCKNILQDEDTIAVGLRRKRVYVYRSMCTSDIKILPDNLRQKYEPCRLLGKGACGEVRLAYEKRTCKMYAIKNIVKTRSTISQIDQLNHPTKIRTEISILKALSHPFVIRMEDIVETEGEVFIVLEYMRGGELTNRILSTEPLTESNVKFFFYQMALAVNYLHSNGIVHRDLKPENVLLLSDEPETVLKVSDFGLSKVIEDDDMMKTMCGTLCYVAPDVLKAGFQKYDKQVDVWSLGVILFYMLSKTLPFRGPEKEKLRALIKNGTYKMEEAAWKGVSFQAKDLIKKMLIVDPQQRITVNEILKHPWVEKDVSMQYRVQSLLNVSLTSKDVSDTCNMEPPTKRVRLSSGEFTE